ncbi:glutamate receptor 2.5-like protein isoform X1 [Cinnamomum micranthum f. kanehirae]|uniref:Glutamate receptor 2.5-like protein isoform X1 n=1 Tax=Cinnamomum micranthum f. kanehirae TaxID=337451 RepID=A0A443PKS6_9MAGN|nr:glutamate receptor 2.5-like protein isoform X1 [Cinnamomum micranthum f. kanehirae]
MGVVSDVKFAKRILLYLIFVITAIMGMNSTASLLIDEKLQSKPEDVATEPGALCSSISTIHVKEHKSVSSEDIRRIPVEHSSSTTHVKKGETTVKLRMLVPTENTFHEFVKVDHDPKGNGMTATGYSVDVFKEVMDSLPYQVSYEFFPYENGQSLDMGYYDELIQQLHLNRYDGVVGDITITSNRSKYGHFTLPYMMSGVSTIVPVKDTYKRSIWWFLNPLTWKWWLAIIVLSLAKGFMLWYFEHENKPEIKGTLSEQEGNILSFFSISVFVQKEKLKTNFTRLLAVVWTFGVLVLVTSYAAKLKSTITSDEDQATVSGIEQLIMNGDYVGYQKGSFVFDLLKHMGFQEEKLKAYSSKEEYAIALSRGSCCNGVSAIIDEIPYIKVFLAKYGDRYTMAGPTFRHGGFGFFFHRSCTIVPDISRAVLKFTEGEKMRELEKKWFGFHELDSYPPQIPQRHEIVNRWFPWRLTEMEVSHTKEISYIVEGECDQATPKADPLEVGVAQNGFSHFPNKSVTHDEI